MFGEARFPRLFIQTINASLISMFASSLVQDSKPRLVVLLLLLLLFLQCLVFPLGHLQVLWILAPAPVPLRRVRRCWSLAQTYSGHHQAWAHASPAYQVQWEQAIPAQCHAGCQHHIWQYWQLEAATPLRFLESHLRTTVSEETIIVVQALNILHPFVFVPQDIWDSRSMFAHTWWTAWAYCAACSGHKRACQGCCQAHHIV